MTLKTSPENGVSSSGVRISASPRLHFLTLHRRNIQRRRHEIDNGIQQGLDSLILERRSAQNGDSVGGHGRPSDDRDETFGRQSLTRQVVLHDPFIQIGQGFQKRIPMFRSLLFHLRRDRAQTERRP